LGLSCRGFAYFVVGKIHVLPYTNKNTPNNVFFKEQYMLLV
jgi:hypothetical protein